MPSIPSTLLHRQGLFNWSFERNLEYRTAAFGQRAYGMLNALGSNDEQGIGLGSQMLNLPTKFQKRLTIARIF